MRWLSLVMLAGGCLSFEAVNTTAQLGQHVGAFEHALDPLGFWCRLSSATGTQPDAECARLDADAKVFRKIPQRIAAWSEALHRMAEDAHAPAFGADAAAAAGELGRVVGLSVPKLDGVGAALDALVKLATDSYRRKALAGSIRQAAPHVKLLVGFARATVALQRERLDALHEQAGKVALGLLEQTPAQVAERMALVHLQDDLSAARDRLADYDRALLAFDAAHARLAAAADRLTSDDAEVYLSILGDLKDIYRGVSP